MYHRLLFVLRLLIVLVFVLSSGALAQEQQAGNTTPAIGVQAQGSAIPPAQVVNDEGGPVVITGSVAYTNPFFTDGVAAPVIILEDQAGFVDRNRYFLMPPESQALGQITSDFYTSPFTYSLALPVEPQGSLRDVDNDGETDTGVQVFAVAYWENVFGDPFLEERDLQGGGWSTAYASTRVSEDPRTEYEIVGGKYVVYAPDDQQGFPSGFGADGKLFTEDDPIVLLPQGYTVVDLDADPFTFDRAREQVIDLIEPQGAALDDFSGMSYTEAFDAMIEKMRKEYAFTEYKGIDWDALSAAFRPRFEEAEANADVAAYQLALMEFTWAIPDGHVASSAFRSDLFAQQTDGGLGMAIRELDDGRVIVNYVLEGGPAAQAGIQLRAEILEINGKSIADAISETVPWSSPFSTEHVRRLQQLRYAIRFPVDAEVEVVYRNPGDAAPTTATLTTIAERESFRFSSFNVGLTGFELPVEYKVLDSGYGYVKIYSFIDNNLLTVQLWERMIQAFNQNSVPGVIIDMRQNGGGWSWLANDMAAYFFNEPHVLGNNAEYNEEVGDFYVDPRGEERFYLPAEEFRYSGEVAVLVGPSCASACEGFAYAMTIADRAAIVGHYPTAGLGGGVEDFVMPEGETVRFTVSRGLDANGEINIEGKGVAPTVKVPVNEETLFSAGDPILDAAIAYLDEALAVEVIDGGEIAIGDTVTLTLAPRQRVQYTLPVAEGDVISLYLRDESGQLDTVLRLYDMVGNLLLENDDLNDQTVNSGFEELEIPAGFDALVLEAATFEDASEGEFTLEVVDVKGGK